MAGASAFCMAFLAMAMGPNVALAQEEAAEAPAPEVKKVYPMNFGLSGEVEGTVKFDKSGLAKMQEADKDGKMKDLPMGVYGDYSASMGFDFSYKGVQTKISIERAGMAINVDEAWGDVEFIDGLHLRGGRMGVGLANHDWIWDQTVEAMRLSYAKSGFYVGFTTVLHQNGADYMKNGAFYHNALKLSYQINDMIGLHAFYTSNLKNAELPATAATPTVLASDFYNLSNINFGANFAFAGIVDGYLDFYYQFGKKPGFVNPANGDDIKIGAYSLDLNVGIKIIDGLKANVGFFMLSKNGDDADKYGAFERIWGGNQGDEGIGFCSDKAIGGRGLFNESIGLSYGYKAFSSSLTMNFAQIMENEGLVDDKGDDLGKSMGAALDLELGYQFKEWFKLGAELNLNFASKTAANLNGIAAPGLDDYNKVPMAFALTATFSPSFNFSVNK
ncbi:MAG: hypothetical protein CSA97_05410 [Bacteroidetes bacterium]|nr:MAG: hypothetical protein CSA97_05410 [Bacteroidota bacterium]